MQNCHVRRQYHLDAHKHLFIYLLWLCRSEMGWRMGGQIGKKKIGDKRSQNNGKLMEFQVLWLKRRILFFHHHSNPLFCSLSFSSSFIIVFYFSLFFFSHTSFLILSFLLFTISLSSITIFLFLLFSSLLSTIFYFHLFLLSHFLFPLTPFFSLHLFTPSSSLSFAFFNPFSSFSHSSSLLIPFA